MLHSKPDCGHSLMQVCTRLTAYIETKPPCAAIHPPGRLDGRQHGRSRHASTITPVRAHPCCSCKGEGVLEASLPLQPLNQSCTTSAGNLERCRLLHCRQAATILSGPVVLTEA